MRLDENDIAENRLNSIFDGFRGEKYITRLTDQGPVNVYTEEYKYWKNKCYGIFVDMVVDRSDLRRTLTFLIDAHMNVQGVRK